MTKKNRNASAKSSAKAKAASVAKTSSKTALKKNKISNSEKNVPLFKLGNQIWPMERDILFRPARLKYVRKLMQPKECVFCISAKNKLSEETLCVYKSKYSQIVLNKFPYNSGHLLVIPLEHIGDIFQLSEAAYADLHLTLRLAMQAIKELYQPSGFNTGMNHGATGGAGIPDHLHYHIVPRWNGDLNFFPLIAETKLVIETVEETYARLKPYFENLISNEKTKSNLKGDL
jgi:ATP adenylyltransferase